MRYFIGISLPENVQKELIRIQEKLKQEKHFLGTYVPPENLHITVLFLGTLSKEEIQTIKALLHRVSVAPFTVQLNTLGTTTRVVWVTLTSPGLVTFHESLTSLLPCTKEKRDFTGHITIARVKKFYQNADFEKHSVVPLSWEATSYGLYESITYQEGPRYNLIEKYLF